MFSYWKIRGLEKSKLSNCETSRQKKIDTKPLKKLLLTSFCLAELQRKGGRKRSTRNRFRGLFRTLDFFRTRTVFTEQSSLANFSSLAIIFLFRENEKEREEKACRLAAIIYRSELRHPTRLAYARARRTHATARPPTHAYVFGKIFFFFHERKRQQWTEGILESRAWGRYTKLHKKFISHRWLGFISKVRSSKADNNLFRMKYRKDSSRKKKKKKEISHFLFATFFVS